MYPYHDVLAAQSIAPESVQKPNYLMDNLWITQMWYLYHPFLRAKSRLCRKIIRQIQTGYHALRSNNCESAVIIN